MNKNKTLKEMSKGELLKTLIKTFFESMLIIVLLAIAVLYATDTLFTITAEQSLRALGMSALLSVGLTIGSTILLFILECSNEKRLKKLEDNPETAEEAKKIVEGVVESDVINIAYADIWDMTKNLYGDSKAVMRMAAGISFVTRILTSAMTSFFVLTGMSLLFGDSINWFGLIAYALLYSGMDVIVYGTFAITKEKYREVFGNVEYQLHAPHSFWRFALIIIAFVVSGLITAKVSV